MSHNAEMIREYVDDYVKFFPEKWSWSLKNSREQNELYRRTRARRSGYRGENNDLLPDFYSIERDADQFDFSQIEWTDFFGLVWEGKKGVLARVGAPNYQGNLYYYKDNDSFDEARYFVSDEYDAYNNQPSPEVYTRVSWNGINHWIDTANTCSVKYKYIVNNHLFKDTYVEMTYGDGESIRIYDDYEHLINNLFKQGKKKLVDIIFKSMNEHFLKLRDSDREDERAFYPGITAEEMFLKDLVTRKGK